MTKLEDDPPPRSAAHAAVAAPLKAQDDVARAQKRTALFDYIESFYNRTRSPYAAAKVESSEQDLVGGRRIERLPVRILTHSFSARLPAAR